MCDGCKDEKDRSNIDECANKGGSYGCAECIAENDFDMRNWRSDQINDGSSKTREVNATRCCRKCIGDECHHDKSWDDEVSIVYAFGYLYIGTHGGTENHKVEHCGDGWRKNCLKHNLTRSMEFSSENRPESDDVDIVSHKKKIDGDYCFITAFFS